MLVSGHARRKLENIRHMGIFDFFNKKNSGNAIANSSIGNTNSFADLKRETDRLRKENDAWQKEFNHIIKLREKAIELDKNGKYFEAIEIFQESIDYGENSNRLNISNYAHDIERVMILYGKTKQIDKQINFIESSINSYPTYPDIDKWRIRLSKITQKDSIETPVNLTLSDIKAPIPSNPTLGRKFQAFKDSLPEFNFYFDMPDDMQTLEYLNIYKPVPFEKSKKLREYRDSFASILSNGQIAENQNNIKIAIETYLKLIAEEYEGKEPFERLIIIYRKLKWKEQEIEILKKGISFFENLRENQRTSIILLASKFGMENKAFEYINADKKIQYYGGAFDLYNPYPIISKWKEKLDRLK